MAAIGLVALVKITRVAGRAPHRTRAGARGGRRRIGSARSRVVDVAVPRDARAVALEAPRQPRCSCDSSDAAERIRMLPSRSPTAAPMLLRRPAARQALIAAHTRSPTAAPVLLRRGCNGGRWEVTISKPHGSPDALATCDRHYGEGSAAARSPTAAQMLLRRGPRRQLLFLHRPRSSTAAPMLLRLTAYLADRSRASTRSPTAAPMLLRRIDAHGGPRASSSSKPHSTPDALATE